jgi:uncharacterized protein DUF3788
MKMSKHEKIQLRDSKELPTSEILEQTLGESYSAYETFQEALPDLDMEQEWQWYTPYKAWFAKGQHWWTTSRGTRKEKTLYWLHVFEGCFDIAVWFTEKNQAELLKAHVSEKTKQLIDEAKPKGKLTTFPVIFDITSTESLDDIYTLIECKKRLECK